MLPILAVLSALACPTAHLAVAAPATALGPRPCPQSETEARDDLRPRKNRAPELSTAEQRLSDRVSASSISAHLRRLTEHPHVSGSPAAAANAAYVRDQLRSFGFEAEIETYLAYLPYPVRLEAEILAPVRKTLDLDDAHARVRDPGTFPGGYPDKDALDTAIPPYNAYSFSGSATGPVVYAHLGRAQDFDSLEQRGVDVRGTICLIRYGGQFRGIKVREASRRGAAAVLLYSDPDDDGYRRGDRHPEGPWRPDTAVQRGSILYLSEFCGDPLTPGYPATEDQDRLRPEDCPWLPDIPCQPISARNATELLRHLDGPLVPRSWQGGCPVPYHCGPGSTSVRLTVELDRGLRPVHNVIGRLRTPKTAPHYLLIGGHRDAWVHGAVDPCSGTALALEAMRVLGELVDDGWDPGFEIRFASWDGEEFGLIGSTEWCEDHADEIQRHCLGYINCDSAVSGTRFGASATPDFVTFLGDVAARTIPHDRKGRLLTRWAHGGSRPPCGELGSGSDYTAFVCRLGIPACDFGSRGAHGVYHSRHDTFFTMEQFLDPGFEIHASMARFVALAAHRFADAARPPLDTAAWGPWLEAAVSPMLDALTPEDAERFNASIHALRGATDSKTAAPLDIDRAVALHDALLDESGIPGRPWFRNVFVAPGIDLGYGAVKLPALREAVDAEDSAAIHAAVDALVARVDAMTHVLQTR